MALALESGNKVWQKVGKALTNANPGAQEAFRGLKTWLAQQKGNPDLQFIPYTAALLVVATGYSPIGVPAKVYGWYGKNTGSGGTDSFINLYDAATNTPSTTAWAANIIQVAGDSFTAIYPNGLAFGTDLTIAATTTIGGETESSAADAADGFLIVGAA